MRREERRWKKRKRKGDRVKKRKERGREEQHRTPDGQRLILSSPTATFEILREAAPPRPLLLLPAHRGSITIPREPYSTNQSRFASATMMDSPARMQHVSGAARDRLRQVLQLLPSLSPPPNVDSSFLPFLFSFLFFSFFR